MKHLISFVAIILLLGTSAAAQQPTVGVTGKGLQLGFGIADISTDYAELNDLVDSRVGFSGGAFLTYSVSRQLAVQPEILYVSKGAGKDLFFFNIHWNIDYLEVPVLLKFNITPDGNVRPNLFAGPALDVLLGSHFHVINETYDVADGMKTMDFGLVFGGGVDYRRMNFNIRYTLGLANTIDATKINKLTGAEPNDFYYLEGDPSVKNTDISFMVGFRL